MIIILWILTLVFAIISIVTSNPMFLMGGVMISLIGIIIEKYR